MLSLTGVYWRAIRRVERRAAAYRNDPMNPATERLLRQACRLANGLGANLPIGRSVRP